MAQKGSQPGASHFDEAIGYNIIDVWEVPICHQRQWKVFVINGHEIQEITDDYYARMH